MRILFVASLHHPQQLREARAAVPDLLFPPSMAQHHWDAALRARGHETEVFYRNLPDGTVKSARAERHTQRITPRKIITALGNRVPPQYDPARRATNARLLANVRAYRPDVVWLVGDNRVIYAATLAEIKKAARVVYASGTSPIVFSHLIEREAAPLYDLVLVNDLYHGMQWRELGAPRMAVLPLSACAPDFHYHYDLTDDERATYTCDVAFVGTLVPGHLYGNRVKALEALRDFDLGIWSVHDVPHSLRPYARGGALGEKMLKIMSAAKVCVNSHGDFMLYGGNLRLFEAAGVGVCQVVDDLPGTHEWFTPGEHLLTYSSIDELCEAVGRVLADDTTREALGAAGQRHAYEHHTYAHRAEQFERLLA